MKLGLLADIHEHVNYLQVALSEFEYRGTDQIVVIGDVVEMGQRIEETTNLLKQAGAVGVWGNHDFGLCHNPDDVSQAKYAPSVIEFMCSLRPRLTIEDCHFTHVEPWLNPEVLADLWYFDGVPDDAEKLAKSFDAVPQHVMFVGHFHRWQLATRDGVLDWHGERTVTLTQNERYLVIVDALCEGRFAIFDTQQLELSPFTARTSL